MGLLIDSSIVIAADRGQLALAELRERLTRTTVAFAAITVSELLHGVHRAESSARRKHRAELLDGLLDVVPVLRNWRRVPLSPNRVLFHRDRKIANARHLILGTWRVQYP